MNHRYQQGIAPIWVILGVIGAGIVGLFIFGLINRPPNQHIADGKPWNEQMSLGRIDAKHTFIDYTDYFCSHCAEVEAVTRDDFKKQYIDSGLLRYEHRPVAVLKEIVPNSERGAEAAFCAADQHKYWQYTHNIVPRIKADYFDKGIGVKNVAVPKEVPLLPIEYFIKSAEASGMNVEQFSSCIKDEKHKQEIADNTKKAVSLGVNGLPYMVINDYRTSGFAGGKQGLDLILKAGGVSTK